MSYTTGKYEVIVAKDAALSSTGDISGGKWAPGFHPHIIRAAMLVVTNAIDNALVIKGDKRPTAGSDSGRGDGDVFVLTVSTTNGALGNVCYADNLDIEIKPGEEVVFEVTDAAAASDTGHLILLVEPRWEVPGNNTDMKDCG
jgi:hypothetical protein